jgi:hypothetical protein
MIGTAKGAMPAALTEAAQLRATAYSSCCAHHHTNHKRRVKSVLKGAQASVLCFGKLPNAIATCQMVEFLLVYLNLT